GSVPAKCYISLRSCITKLSRRFIAISSCVANSHETPGDLRCSPVPPVEGCPGLALSLSRQCCCQVATRRLRHGKASALPVGQHRGPRHHRYALVASPAIPVPGIALNHNCIAQYKCIVQYNYGRESMPAPTQVAYTELQQAFDHFNATLFAGALSLPLF